MSPLKSKSKSERNDKAATDSIDKEEAAIASYRWPSEQTRQTIAATVLT